MLVLKILGFIAIVIIILILLGLMNAKYLEKFNFAIFSVPMVIGQFITGLCFFIGREWYISAIAHNGDKLNGLVLIGFGAVITISVIIYIYYMTNFIYGTIGTIVYIAASVFFVFISYLIILFLMGYFILIFLSGSSNSNKK